MIQVIIALGILAVALLALAWYLLWHNDAKLKERIDDLEGTINSTPNLAKYSGFLTECD